MATRSVLLYAAALCMASLALEGFCAGGGIRQRLKELRQPRFVPPLWGWVVIGAFYYVMCFAVLYRLFALPPTVAFRNSAILGAVALMSINAAWNWFFFRTRNLWHAFVIGVPYSILAIALFLLLLGIDRIAAAWLALYLPYLCFANVWGYRLWKLNSHP
jgi:tryptophan-rich sensory protein